MTDSLGRWLRSEREMRQISLPELAQTTRIPLKSLRALEEDRQTDLPGDVFVRGFVRSIAKALGVPVEEALERHGASRRAPGEGSAPVLSGVGGEGGGRRFGIAIALVILAILFTLALSIVLRPRHRDTPVELSLSTSPLRLELSQNGAAALPIG
jgi:cytoskeletal protein RodZ